jgi:hypothetical protein
MVRYGSLLAFIFIICVLGSNEKYYASIDLSVERSIGYESSSTFSVVVNKLNPLEVTEPSGKYLNFGSFEVLSPVPTKYVIVGMKSLNHVMTVTLNVKAYGSNESTSGHVTRSVPSPSPAAVFSRGDSCM